MSSMSNVLQIIKFTKKIPKFVQIKFAFHILRKHNFEDNFFSGNVPDVKRISEMLHMSNVATVKCRICQMSHISNVVNIKYHICQMLFMSNIASNSNKVSVQCRICQMSHLSNI